MPAVGDVEPAFGQRRLADALLEQPPRARLVQHRADRLEDQVPDRHPIELILVVLLAGCRGRLDTVRDLPAEHLVEPGLVGGQRRREPLAVLGADHPLGEVDPLVLGQRVPGDLGILAAQPNHPPDLERIVGPQGIRQPHAEPGVGQGHDQPVRRDPAMFPPDQRREGRTAHRHGGRNGGIAQPEVGRELVRGGRHLPTDRPVGQPDAAVVEDERRRPSIGRHILDVTDVRDRTGDQFGPGAQARVRTSENRNGSRYDSGCVVPPTRCWRNA